MIIYLFRRAPSNEAAMGVARFLVGAVFVGLALVEKKRDTAEAISLKTRQQASLEGTAFQPVHENEGEDGLFDPVADAEGQSRPDPSELNGSALSVD